MLNEHFELSPNIKLECTRLAEYIASFLLPTFESNIEHTERKDNLSIIKYNEYVRLARQYKNNKQYFNIKKSDVPTKWGDSDFFISSKNGIFPRVFVKFSRGYSQAVDAYVTKDDPTILILIDLLFFSRAFKKHTAWLKEVVEHEMRHFIQSTGDTVKGLPKHKARSWNLDIYGINKQGYITTHPMRDIEFKPNIYSYAYYIKKHLDRNYAHPNWKNGFKDLLSGKDKFSKFEEIRNILSLLDEVKQANRERWKLYVKEIYNLIFK